MTKKDSSACSVDDCSARSTTKSGYCPIHRPKCIIDNCENLLACDNQTGHCKPHRHLHPLVKVQLNVTSKKWRKDNLARVNECRRIQYANSPDKQKLSGKSWKDKNPDKVKEYSRRYYVDNSDILLEKSTKWAKDNPDLARAKNQKRRAALILGAKTGTIDLFSIWCRDAGLCFICGFPADKDDWWLEHIIPLSRGGLHVYDNVAVSHQYCNNRKYNKLMEELGEWFNPWDSYDE